MGFAMRERLWSTPALFPLRLVVRENKLLWVPVSEQRYREVNFLDDRELSTQDCEESALDEVLRDHESMRLPRRPVHCIFHMAYCGSTLLSRCLGHLDHAHVLREPLCLHELAEEKRHGLSNERDANEWSGRFDLVMALLARTFRPDQVSIVKTTDASTHLVADVLRRSEAARALFLYVDLEDFLGAVLGDEERRGFVRLRLADLSVLLPDDPMFHANDHGDWSDAMQASLLWVLQMHVYASFVEANPHAACRSLDFAEIARDPVRAVSAAARFLGLDAATRAFSPAIEAQLQVHSKDLHTPFTFEDRRRKTTAAITLHRGEIRKARTFAAQYLARAGVPEHVPLPLDLQ
jgi:hypothetical protein